MEAVRIGQAGIQPYAVMRSYTDEDVDWVEAEIVALTIGSARAGEALSMALAMGADRGIHIGTDVAFDAIANSAAVAHTAWTEEVKLIFCGGHQADQPILDSKSCLQVKLESTKETASMSNPQLAVAVDSRDEAQIAEPAPSRKKWSPKSSPNGSDS